MQQMSLFNTSSEMAGFRLDYMEIWNWGTFDGKVYRIAPQGNNSLLTGANASGKSTLIDALLTLLVPLKRNRFYNQSSGVEKKGDRTEESYFFGNYGNQQQEGGSGTKTLRLRNKESRSVLLACFKSAEDRIVTLFQVRYFAAEELKTVYGIARTRLEIDTDLQEFDNKGVWRRHLEKKYNAHSPKKMIDFCGGPVEYGERICDLFGMKSDKALQLFNQIIGVKVLDDLNTFIHDNMLEEQKAEEKYIELKQNFQNLMEAKLSIDKANLQIEQLKPIVALAKEMEEIQTKVDGLDGEKSVAAYWFAQKMLGLCDLQLHDIEANLTRLNQEVKRLNEEHEQLDNERTSLRVSIENDEVGKEIRKLEEAIAQLEATCRQRRQKAENYRTLAQPFHLATDPDQETFEQNRKAAQEKRQQLQAQNEELSSLIPHLEQEMLELDKQIEEQVKDIRYLEQHHHNITGDMADIREQILQHTGATTEEMPFVGELIQVKEEEHAWELAIEKILHHIALRLIVPEDYYEKVNEYVNSHNLKGRIVYQQYKEFTSLKELEGRNLEDNCLLKKIEINDKSRYHEWVEDLVYRQYNYACVHSLDEFARYEEKAVTREGLIKSVKGKHEKDDRPHTLNKENFVLGWDNREKLHKLKENVRQWQEQQQAIAAKIQQAQAQRRQNKTQEDQLSQLFYGFEHFQEMDWRSQVQAIQEKMEAKQHLEDSNDTIKTLQNQLTLVEKKLKDLRHTESECTKETIYQQQAQEKLTQQQRDCRQLIERSGQVDTSAFAQQHPELHDIRLEQLDAQRRDYHLRNEKETNDLKTKLTKKGNKASALISRFKNPDTSITEKFRDWRSDVSNLPEGDHLELIGEYEAYYKRLVDEDLISFQGQFNKYLQETITHHVNSFRIFFQRWEDTIRQTIEQLNAPLREIDFDQHPATYIQLVASKKLDLDTQEFKNLLQAAIPNLHDIEQSIDGRKQHFENHIEPFIRRLEDETWRSKVMDVRSWFTYKAEEFFKEDQQKRKTYESMGQLSGGEKAQLTYTILGSAIACQFGLTKSGLDSSFRFIAIDEAFKAQDETKARYLLSLCQQLHLQLLVVTPSDNIHIVENDISYVHYVERQGDRSVLYNMPIMQYKNERKKHESE